MNVFAFDLKIGHVVVLFLLRDPVKMNVSFKTETEAAVSGNLFIFINF